MAMIIATAAELRGKTFPPIRFVAPFIAEGCTMLAGRPKIGKSWLMLATGLDVAREGGDVLYLALEDNERRLQTRIGKLLGPAGEWPARFQYATQWLRADQGGLSGIREWIRKAEKPTLVVVDVLANFRPPRGRDAYESDYGAVKDLQRIASETGVAIVIVHHLRKSSANGAEADPFEKVSGTLGLSGAADTVLVLDRDSRGATLYGRGRDIEDIDMAVEFDRQSCRWRPLGDAAEVRRSDERKAILAALAKAEGPLSPGEVAKLLGRSRDAVQQTLGRMVRDGEIAKAGRGKYTVVTARDGGCHNGEGAERSAHTGCHKCHNVTTGAKPFDVSGILRQRL